MIIQPRDLALLDQLFLFRVMTARQIAILIFNGRTEAAKKRITKLKKAGFIRARTRHPSDPAILFVARKGLKILQDEGILAKYPPMSLRAQEARAQVSERTMRHELEIVDVRVTLRQNSREFMPWPLLTQFEARRSDGLVVLVKPDAFLTFQTPQGSENFFLELDRSTETLDTLVARCGCYLDYYRSGSFALRQGSPRSAFKQHPFRVIIVCKSDERRNNLARQLRLHSPPILTLVYLATLSDLMRDPSGAIWLRPLDTPANGNPTLSKSSLPLRHLFDRSKKRDH